MFFYLVVWYGEKHFKLGLTRRLPKYRLNDYETGDVMCKFHKVVYFPNMILEQLYEIEKNCLSATKQYAHRLDEKPNNESRYDVEPETLWQICSKYFPANHVIYDDHGTILKLTIDDCPGVLETEPTDLVYPPKPSYFASIDELNAYVPIEPYKPKELKPRPHQDVNKLLNYFENNNKGILWWAPGAGKTKFTIMWLKQLMNKHKKNIIGCPSKALIRMWQLECEEYLTDEVYIIDGLEQFNESTKPCILIVGYWDSFKIINKQCDILVLDECHHLASASNNKVDIDSKKNMEDLKPWQKILSVKSTYQLGLTATVKNLELKHDNSNTHIISNDDEKYFGSIIDTISIASAIRQDFIVDYKVCITHLTKEDAEDIKQQIESEADLDLIISAYIILKMIHDGIVTKALIYCNKIENAKIIDKIISSIIEKKIIDFGDNWFYHNAIDCTKLEKYRNEEINKFENAIYGVVTSVYIFGEGVDYPFVDCECFAESMDSTIRIVQAAMRGSRHFKLNRDKIKINYLVLPIINADNYLNDKTKFSKITKLVRKLNTVDEGVLSKLVCDKIDFNTKVKTKTKKVKEEIKINTDVINKDLLSKITTMIISDMSKVKNMTGFEFAKLLRNQNIETETDYLNKFADHYDDIYVPNPIDIYKGFTWELLDSNNDCYINKEECIKVIELITSDKKHKAKLLSMTINKRVIYIQNIDSLFPSLIKLKKIFNNKLPYVLQNNGRQRL